ncbi:hypothetical protein [Alkaliphilus hydrothermalis]|uniref:Uncharacterized protein n=1 Tax=Alkaliphilus hydrothermalis TaxID=1482730 RepID=A0ABS2NS44_9FIRM|nr:hypothetical protein [Alkaliphilus hydrothermalis]MBM7615780.1 hypothetical protein [Alkaliphilus hydrothermalis]
MAHELITEKVITYIYQQEEDQGKLKELEAKFLDKTDGLAYQFSDWLVYDYPANNKQTYGEGYLQQVGAELPVDEVEYIKNCLQSYLGFYELIKIKENILHIKNIFTNEEHTLQKDAVEEDVNLHEILLVRLTQGDVPQIVSSQITVLPHQYKTLLIGQVIEDYDQAKGRKSYLSFPQYFKENLTTVLGIVNKLSSYRDQEGDVTLHQTVYAVVDYFRTKEALNNTKEIVVEDVEEGIYHLMEADLLLAVLVLQKKKLEVECSNKSDQKNAKEFLQDKLRELIVFMKDEELTIDDII